MEFPKQFRVVVAEDDPLVRMIIERELQLLGVEVVGRASDGKEALALVLEKKPDIAILDVEMPEMRGTDVALAIMEQCPTPVVLLTAYSDPAIVQMAAKAGVGAYLIKPLNTREMERALWIAYARFQDLQELKKLNSELKDALEQVKTLRGLLPICAWCKRIRTDDGLWQQVEQYISEHSDADFSHGICPDCRQKL